MRSGLHMIALVKAGLAVGRLNSPESSPLQQYAYRIPKILIVNNKDRLHESL